MAATTSNPRLRLAQIGPPDKWILAPVIAMVMLGIVMIYSSSFAEGFLLNNSASYYLVKQLQWLCLGGVALFVCSRVPYYQWRRVSVLGLALGLLGLAAVVVLPESLAPSINGARRWIKVGPFTAQPSEFVKLAFIIYAADWLSQKGEKVRNLWYGLIPFGITLGFIVGLVMLEPDMGTSLVFATIGLSMFFVAGAHLLQLAGGMALAAAAFTVLIFSASYRLNRLTIFLDPWSDPTGAGYHPIQALLALGSGGLGGRGLGVSRQKFSWLFAAHTDSIMAVIGEELGFVGSVLVVALIVALAIRGFSTVLRAADGFGALLATGITAWVVGQSALNIAVITLTVPFTGIPLPFISYGGSSLVVMLAAVGILLNVSRYTRPPESSTSRARETRRARWRSERKVSA